MKWESAAGHKGNVIRLKKKKLPRSSAGLPLVLVVNKNFIILSKQCN